MIIKTFLVADLKLELLSYLKTALNLPFLVSLVSLNVALPLLLVLALYVLPLTFKVTFAFFTAFPLI